MSDLANQTLSDIRQRPGFRQGVECCPPPGLCPEGLTIGQIAGYNRFVSETNRDLRIALPSIRLTLSESHAR